MFADTLLTVQGERSRFFGPEASDDGAYQWRIRRGDRLPQSQERRQRFLFQRLYRYRAAAQRVCDRQRRSA
ncbi:hypothetical protein LP420_22805 [Massilia sp. B-10]|nr:hypothetical protein LP420_22805 [Massilia sp. B-10]